MNLSRVTNDYRNGVQTFLNFAFQIASQENMILCPCKKCGNINWHFLYVVYEHLIVNGFIQGYKKWIFHGECTPSRTASTINLTYPHSESVREDDMEGILRDAFNMLSHGLQPFPPNFIASNDCNIGGNIFTEKGRSVPDKKPNEEEAKFYKLLNEMNEELYEGSKYLKLSFCIHLFHLKCLEGLIRNSFTMLLVFLRVHKIKPMIQVSRPNFRSMDVMGLHYLKGQQQGQRSSKSNQDLIKFSMCE
ncbi:hypothetical protein PVK06_024588 [Gossypium arboreum]|uniref:Transposase-associated domain-containing protein n=1 Tax=Gossypium arboreum TaxID=29729 RepID=A0ABR0PEH6_GOSAR|nr:hypothetical protein PVK06_024588 [Gossypium arboreum]